MRFSLYALPALFAVDSLIDEVSYAIGVLTKTRHQDAAGSYLSFLQSDQGQNAYVKFGFIQASKADLAIRDIP